MAETRLPPGLYRAAEVRALELALGFSAHALMMQAAAAVLRQLQSKWSEITQITVVCGVGNNAGDGYALASLARGSGYHVRVVQVGNNDGLDEPARLCLETMVAAGIDLEAEFDSIDNAELIVDALFGIGLSRPVEGEFAAAIDRINQTSRPIISVDMPSGVNADTGVSMGKAVRATLTVTFLVLKQGLFSGDGPDYAGTVVFDDLELTKCADAKVEPSSRLFTMSDVASELRPRARTAHKGDHGHVLVCGGAPGYSGALQLAGMAAARAGAGLISLAAHPEVVRVLTSVYPELMIHMVETVDEFVDLIARADVVAIGPGLGESDWALTLFAAALSCELPMVVDADALNLLALEPTVRDNWILTPHPGEASRLLATSTRNVQADRFTAASSLQQRYGGTIVLKGAGSIIDDGQLPAVLCAGNPGMGSGGMGDVLTGVIAALVAQGLAIDDAARIGACVHANAADRAATDGERGLLASDLLPHIRALVN